MVGEGEGEGEGGAQSLANRKSVPTLQAVLVLNC